MSDNAKWVVTADGSRVGIYLTYEGARGTVEMLSRKTVERGSFKHRVITMMRHRER